MKCLLRNREHRTTWMQKNLSAQTDHNRINTCHSKYSLPSQSQPWTNQISPIARIFQTDPPCSCHALGRRVEGEMREISIWRISFLGDGGDTPHHRHPRRERVKPTIYKITPKTPHLRTVKIWFTLKPLGRLSFVLIPSEA